MVADAATSASRRAFLAGCAGCAAAVVTPTDVSASTVGAPNRGATYGTARASLEGRHELLAHEHAQQQQGNGIQFDQQVNAVEDLGCDPNGNEPVESTLNSSIEEGMLVVFPGGNYRATDSINPSANRFGIVGEGHEQATQPPEPGDGTVSFVVDSGQRIDLFNTSGDMMLIANFVIDQRADGAHGGLKARSSGNVRVRDVRTVGPQTAVGDDSTPPFLSPIVDSDDALLVVERFVARGGGIPGTKNIGASSGVGIFGRDAAGTIVLRECVIENMASNGIYGARTTATVNVLGGLYRNNDVSQVRVNGDATVDGVDIVIDEQNYSGLRTKSHAAERGPGWPNTNGLKIETKPSISATTGATVRNSEIVGASVADESGVGGLVRVWDSGGAVTLANCRITNQIPETESIYAEEPGSGNYPAAPEPWRITLENSVIRGSGAGGPAANIQGRPRSLIRNTCLQYSGASQSDIRGANTSGVSYGQQCEGVGLSAPDDVGSGANVSSVPVSVNGSTAGGGGGGVGVAKALLAAAGLLVLIVIVSVAGVPSLGIGLGVLGSLILSYLLDDD